jgi:hypothetical protein
VLRGKYTAITLAVLGYKAVIEVDDQKICDPSSPPALPSDADASYPVPGVTSNSVFEHPVKVEDEDSQLRELAQPSEVAGSERGLLLGRLPDTPGEDSQANVGRGACQNKPFFCLKYGCN